MKTKRSRRRVAAAAVTATAVVAAGLASGLLKNPFDPADASAIPSVRPGCSVAQLTRGWSAGTLHLAVRDVDTDRSLAGIRADEPAATGSTMKVLTMAAAVTTLGADTRLTTRVLQGADPGAVILVGGGDPTLSRLPSGQSSVYPQAPHLDALAAETLAARQADPRLADVPITTLEVDSSLFGGPAWLPTWSDSARTTGSVSNITALMVDGDRDDPTNEYSKRGDAAVMRAADAFAPLLGGSVRVDPALVTAPAGATKLASVESAPVAELARYTLTHSDDTLAETLGRLVAVNAGTGSTFDGIQGGTGGSLDRLGVSADGLRLADASGLSSDDAVTATAMTRLMVQVARRDHGLGPVDDGLSVAGRTGTLAENGRFQTSNREAAGRIRGKTGTLDDMYGLTAIADPRAGHRVAFTIWAERVPAGTDPATARQAVDGLATALYRCGAGLTP
ncbi:D-alanyl-D-alanine carboxypeptidase/D-alanyl-D-alanine-endopeptidase (penicillin-binding protein 4) [Frondihabitans sp. PhB188]|uniref:D-alanyl-D-alanine carboxypeptidase/D-alanyl-D-alanine-endopeptidase n=1 Tax=Frondihabitans sp. PhB188 TaxID=2485200 RepID=UPI000F46D48D|nr:D-alanyl-D-alanine carboxypeptidase [Frondihabitans sp. PhB188]ROQ36593.1 D-alanyl-D-alanine carboxypeptidase/D-alanyl-D-alanine-endopeptidase (penicillin-binding protein 4) [Frondihabitans sp. PhB188]